MVKISHISKCEKVWVGNIISQDGPNEEDVIRSIVNILTITLLLHMLL